MITALFILIPICLGFGLLFYKGVNRDPNDYLDVCCCKQCRVPLRFVNESESELTMCPVCRQIEPKTIYLHAEDFI